MPINQHKKLNIKIKKLKKEEIKIQRFQVKTRRGQLLGEHLLMSNF